MNKILCVRIHLGELGEDVKSALRAAHGSDVVLEYVNPQTPSQLDELAANPEVVATFLQPNPIPDNQIKGHGKGDPNIKPIIVMGTDGLEQVTDINVTKVPYKPK